ncbi:2-phosphosulfolactate phosphatase [Bacillus sp. FJAT-42376]|uniref:2-phosphosulfolactate phosphatase n=1 Tax=Bacillus sp. FJAT-42376 TaxID=2014076 RepID=UPI000F4FC28E|nr:2-phosphosulfolactate phosphatase [Bacillus sp. FJAT-42376]AZB44007.1 2-phosphosulfolactate phosphatase [Bacillus sp. FJAT-42376]
MGKIHVLMKKEEIDPNKMEGKIAVVFDVLLATTTISSVLFNGAKEVIPVMNAEEARTAAAGLEPNAFVLIGEYEGKTIEGFLDPGPSALKNKVRGKIAILSTTNGTVAIRKSSSAKAVYAASLLNARTAADYLLSEYPEETLILVCSGSSGQFCIEDFLGAGCLIELLTERTPWELTDSALAAKLFYSNLKAKKNELLASSRVGRMLNKYGYGREIDYAGQTNVYDVLPVLKERSLKGIKGE